MDYGGRKEPFSYIFSFLCFHYFRDGIIFLITNRVNKQIILQRNAGASMW